MLKSLLNWLYPPRCIFCGKLTQTQEKICEVCYKSILWIHKPACSLCGRPMEECNCFGRKMVWDGCTAVAYYGAVVKRGIASFKFYGRRHIGSDLGKMMADRVKETFLDISFDWVVPAPLSKKRMRKRNYNQAYLLAWEISKQLGVKIGTEILKKERDTPQQSRLSKYERQKNLKGAFGVKKRSAILGRTILLVDDVTTTGATLEECARTLKAAGAGSIYCVAFALSADKQARNDNGETGCIKKINT